MTFETQKNYGYDNNKKTDNAETFTHCMYKN